MAYAHVPHQTIPCIRERTPALLTALVLSTLAFSALPGKAEEQSKTTPVNSDIVLCATSSTLKQDRYVEAITQPIPGSFVEETRVEAQQLSILAQAQQNG
ncbi:hypothetical protein PUV47_02465 [Pseudovibrio exalbescens]|uniref:hypothetical protein n=1 Tax=Pseudovibrio exalbescens TaxID=197461 RepID=UPI0023650AF8|nr:hypothetical protein [Pseudovibrio exalbescens]MDD7908768.1 hypothetical protein [Pseudovibrio exalbescens]